MIRAVLMSHVTKICLLLTEGPSTTCSIIAENLAKLIGKIIVKA